MAFQLNWAAAQYVKPTKFNYNTHPRTSNLFLNRGQFTTPSKHAKARKLRALHRIMKRKLKSNLKFRVQNSFA